MTSLLESPQSSESSSQRSPYVPQNQRRVLCVFPKYSRSFGTFHHAYSLMQNVRAFMPPQGLLVVAAYLPKQWQVRFVDENVKSATAADYKWADVVIASGCTSSDRRSIILMTLPIEPEKSRLLAGRRFRGAPNIILILISCTWAS